MNYYITHTDKNYINIVEKLFDSLQINSKHKIIYFTVNFEYESKYDNVICVPYYTEFEYSDFDIPNRNILNNNENTRANLLFLKSKICRDALQLGDHNFCYIDADCVALKNCDDIFNSVDKSINYPLLGKNCHEYMIYAGKGNPFANGGFDLNLCLEADLLKFLNIPIEKRTPLYRQSNLFLFTNKCKNILEEWAQICYKKEIIDNWKNYAGFNDETILNCLLWKNNYDKNLNDISVNIPYIKDGVLVNESYLNNFINAFLFPKNESYFFDVFCKIPSSKDINQVKFLHGRISDQQYAIIKEKIFNCDIHSVFFNHKNDLYFNFFAKKYFDAPIYFECYGIHDNIEHLIFKNVLNIEGDCGFYFDGYSPIALFDKIKLKYTHGSIKNSIDIDNSDLYNKIFKNKKIDWKEKQQLLDHAFILKEIFIDKCYRKPKIFDSKKIIDIGSNVGWFLKYIQDNTIVEKAVAVEADSRLTPIYEIINQENLNKILYLNKAFDSKSNEKVELLKAVSIFSCGSQTTNKDFINSNPDYEKEIVNTINFHDLTSYFDEIDLIKSDCEGSEVHIFQKENENILKNKVKKIIFENHELRNNESHPLNNKKVIEFFEKNNFWCYWKYLGVGGESDLYIDYCLNKKFYSLNKILYLAPHLSTGGMPKYLLEKIKIDLRNNKEVYVVEFNFYGDAFVVQRNEIKKLLGDRFIPVFGDFQKLIDALKNINPDILHIQDEPEIFPNISKQQFEEIYTKDREYFIHETCHNSEYDPSHKTLIPDKFVFCTSWMENIYKNILISKELCDIDFESKQKQRDLNIQALNLDPNKKHIVQVGLFNDNKNQKYTFELAKKLLNYNIEFHFIGNLADNFKNDWSPLIENKPENCRIWGERSDVDSFLNICDLFIMPSKKELNPISIKEALAYGNKCIISNIDTLKNKYHLYNDVYWLSNDINNDADTIKNILKITDKKIKFGLVTSFYNVEKYVEETVESVLNQTYKNWIWFVTDDGSSDSTKEKIMKYCKNIPNMIYVDQKFKKEMFWQPQRFVSKDCDYVVTIDSDDFLLPKALEVYNNVLLKNDLVSLSCENIAFKEKFIPENLLNGSFIDFSGIYSEKYKKRKYDENELWTTQKSLHHWGHLRCFKNIEGLDFGINEYNAGCNNDTLHFSVLQKYGTHLNVKRYLYKYRYREKGISHRILTDQEWFEHNKINQIIFNLNNENYFPCSEKYNIDYNNYNSLLLSDFNYQSKPCEISLITNKINDENSFKELYFDHNIVINKISNQTKYIIINAEIGIESIQKILNDIKNIDYKEVSIYSCCSQDITKEELEKITNQNFNVLKEIFLSNFGWYWSSSYYRHLYFKIFR